MNLKTIIKISRPRFWLYLFGPFVIGYTAGLDSLSNVNLIEFGLLSIYFLFIANFLLYGINDLYDQDTDELNIKKGEKEYKLISKEEKYLRALLSIMILISLGYFIFIGGSAGIFFGLFIFLAIFYSAKPLRFKTRPFLDHLSNSLYYLPAIVGYILTSGKIPGIEIFVIGTAWTSAMHLFSAIPDIEVDKQAGIRTTATVLGYRNSLILCVVYWLIFSIIVIGLSGLGYLSLFTLVYVMIPVYILIRKSADINKIYWYFPYINSLLGIGLFLYVLKGLL